MLQTTTPRVILGIDPGTNILGYGVLFCDIQKYEVQAAGVIKLDHLDSPYEKLQRIHKKTSELIKQYQPDELAIEAPFFGKNVQSMLKLGRAQGVAIGVAMVLGLQVYEYAPRKIKQSITGNGNADKAQVCAMIMQLLKMETMPSYLDTTDALAVALCHAFQNNASKSTSNKDWKSFISNNPTRVKK